MKYQSGIAAFIMAILIFSGFIFILVVIRYNYLPIFGILVIATGFGCGLITRKAIVIHKSTLLFMIFGFMIVGGILIWSQSLSDTVPVREPDPEEEGPPRVMIPLMSPRGAFTLAAILYGLIVIFITPVVWISGLIGVKTSHYLFKKQGAESESDLN